ncbi:hypothetical protein B488_05100 [Liberibacter crescens BT-1]|uniref:Uncharacterized protein n=1 Tax=Liberibacter crescens (strain BT-1) TaxID=1215343 RepID=L0EU88_LIBCB|nr:hypothetical protein [Liberibacter crescens]AGA64502.1 hypothetical protein B488_05100 [Liberibacter crescens BT-1]AMC12658.1 hypothetical protein RL73_02645 [Liberibacter crescens]
MADEINTENADVTGKENGNGRTKSSAPVEPVVMVELYRDSWCGPDGEKVDAGKKIKIPQSLGEEYVNSGTARIISGET